MPNKFSKKTKQQIDELRSEIGINLDEIEDLVKEEARTRRRSR